MGSGAMTVVNSGYSYLDLASEWGRPVEENRPSTKNTAGCQTVGHRHIRHFIVGNGYAYSERSCYRIRKYS